MKKLLIASLFILLTSCAASSTSNTVSEANVDPLNDAQVSTPVVVKEESTAPVTKPTLKDKISSCTCVKMWMPVCGENKKTYGNTCEADCAGVKYTNGACKKMK